MNSVLESYIITIYIYLYIHIRNNTETGPPPESETNITVMTFVVRSMDIIFDEALKKRDRYLRLQYNTIMYIIVAGPK